MVNRRGDVIDRALAVLDAHGLGDLTMRRLATELDVRPSALYHHFPNKQALLGAVADTLLVRGPRAGGATRGSWDEQLAAACSSLRDALLAHRDGAELVATVRALGTGGRAPEEAVAAVLAGSGLDDEGVRVATRTLLHFVLGHTMEEQTHLQAASAGAIEDEVLQESDFHLGLALVLDGVRQRVRTGPPAPSARSGRAPRR